MVIFTPPNPSSVRDQSRARSTTRSPVLSNRRRTSASQLPTKVARRMKRVERQARTVVTGPHASSPIGQIGKLHGPAITLSGESPATVSDYASRCDDNRGTRWPPVLCSPRGLPEDLLHSSESLHA